jgi:hypothetical protein
MTFLDELRTMSEDEQASAIDDKIADTCHLIVETTEFEREAGRTSAVNWDVGEYEVTEFVLDEEECLVRLTFAARGEQLEDTFFAGDRVDGTAEAVIDASGEVSYCTHTAEVSDGADWDSGGDDF